MKNRRMPNGMYGGVRGRKTKEENFRFPPTRFWGPVEISERLALFRRVETFLLWPRPSQCLCAAPTSAANGAHLCFRAQKLRNCAGIAADSRFPAQIPAFCAGLFAVGLNP